MSWSIDDQKGNVSNSNYMDLSSTVGLIVIIIVSQGLVLIS